MTLRAEWIDSEREPTQPPDPRYPDGIDLDVTGGAKWFCETPLAYPAKRCGLWVIRCDLCRKRVAVTTAGRPDDPRSVKIACKFYEGGNGRH